MKLEFPSGLHHSLTRLRSNVGPFFFSPALLQLFRFLDPPEGGLDSGLDLLLRLGSHLSVKYQVDEPRSPSLHHRASEGLRFLLVSSRPGPGPGLLQTWSWSLVSSRPGPGLWSRRCSRSLLVCSDEPQSCLHVLVSPGDSSRLTSWSSLLLLT